MAWRRPGDKPLSEPMMIILLMLICITRPQWVNHLVTIWYLFSSSVRSPVVRVLLDVGSIVWIWMGQDDPMISVNITYDQPINSLATYEHVRGSFIRLKWCRWFWQLRKRLWQMEMVQFCSFIQVIWCMKYMMGIWYIFLRIQNNLPLIKLS